MVAFDRGNEVNQHAGQDSIFRESNPHLMSQIAFSNHLEKIIALVVYEDERREIDHIDFPNGLHSQFFVFNEFHFLYILLGKNRCRPTDRT